MLRGLYTLTSGMLTQQRKLDSISNNMANQSTPGFKRDSVIATTFQEELAVRVENTDRSETAPLGTISMIVTPDETVSDFEQGAFDNTERPLDFALSGNGFFEVQRPDGSMVYTRNGSFTLDDEGSLYLQHVGRVMGVDGGPIQLETDRVTTDKTGTIHLLDGGQPIGQIRVVDFNDYHLLVKNGEGMFQNADPQNVSGTNPPTTAVLEKNVERSNVDSVTEMVSMIASQRALQSSSQIIKIYDQIMAKATSEIGRV